MSYNLIFNWILPDQLKILIFFIFLNLVRFQLLISRMPLIWKLWYKRSCIKHLLVFSVEIFKFSISSHIIPHVKSSQHSTIFKVCYKPPITTHNAQLWLSVPLLVLENCFIEGPSSSTHWTSHSRSRCRQPPLIFFFFVFLSFSFFFFLKKKNSFWDLCLY
jgi:hypothetical protein